MRSSNILFPIIFLLFVHFLRGDDMLPIKVGDLTWHIEASAPDDFWVDSQGAPDNGPSLVGRAFPGREGRWVSEPIEIQGGRAYLFSALVRSQLNSAQGRLEMVFQNDQGKELARFDSRTIFWHHNWALYKVVGVSPKEAKKAILRLAVFGPGQNSSGEVRMCNPSLALTAKIEANITTKGNILIYPKRGILNISISGVPQNLLLKIKCQILDFELNPVFTKESSLKAGTNRLELPLLNPGYYTIKILVEGEGISPNEEEISLGVITPLPQDFDRKESPICLDAGMSWSYAPDEERLDLACYLCEIAGIGLLRDRLWWGEAESEEGQFKWGRYAQSALAQARHNIIVYQVFHDCPAWASIELKGGKKAYNQPPRDPIYVYRMVNRLVKDLGKYVRYFEVWNEPNIGFFNGRPEDYSAVLKSAYLGAKDADPRFGILIGSAAGTPGEFYERVFENDVGGYLDIYNQHWYGSPEELFNFLPNVVIAQLKKYQLDNKPIWMTEMGMRAYPDEKGEFKEVERQQASYLVRAYASAFANGISRFFYFYLCEFLEGSVSLWGIVRSDLTPKPTYIALANMIRQLGEAKCIGWKKINNTYIVAFRRNKSEYVLVVWGKEGERISLPAKGPIVDIVGRTVQKEKSRVTPINVQLSDMPLYIRGVMEKELKNLNLEQPIPSKDWTPTPDHELDKKRIWLQLEVNPDQPRSGDENEKWGAYIEPDKPFVVRAYVNNYSDKPSVVTITCQPDEMFNLEGEETMKLMVKPWQRAHHDFVLVGKNIVQGQKMGVTVVMKTENSEQKGRVYLQSRSSNVMVKEEKIIFDGDSDLSIVSKNHSPTTDLKIALDDSVGYEEKPSLMIEGKIKSTGDAWVFPIFNLPAEMNLDKYKGIEVWSYVEAGKEKNIDLRVQLIEEDGGTYILLPARSFRESGWRRDILILESAQPTPWGPDPDGKLDLSKVRKIMVGWGGYSGRMEEHIVFWIGKLSAINFGNK